MRRLVQIYRHRFIGLLLGFAITLCLQAQESPYQLDWGREATIIGLSAGTMIGNHFLHQSIPTLTRQQIETLDRGKVWGFDRGATRNWSTSASDASDIALFTAGFIPFALGATNSIRRDYLNVGVLFLETLLVNTALTDLTKGVARRYRPLVYNPDAPLESKTATSARLSFYSGHTSGSAAFTFFAAKVFSDHFPESKWKPVIWTVASVLPATTGYLRYRAGKHYPSDVIIGYLAGAAVGYFVPHLHKHTYDSRVSLIPSIGLEGASLKFRLHF